MLVVLSLLYTRSRGGCKTVAIVLEQGHASASLLQRKLKIGYTRAARLVDKMEAEGYISGYAGSKSREVLITNEELSSRILDASSKHPKSIT